MTGEIASGVVVWYLWRVSCKLDIAVSQSRCYDPDKVILAYLQLLLSLLVDLLKCIRLVL